MKFRDLYAENPNHFYDWQAVRHYSIYGSKYSKEDTIRFIADWNNGEAKLNDWLKHEKINVNELTEAAAAEKKPMIVKRQHQLYDWWLEYKVQYKYLAGLRDVINHAPWSAKDFALQKLKELEKYLSGDMKGFEPFMFTNSFNLQPKIDYPQIVRDLSNTFENFNQIYDSGFKHEAAALVRCRNYLIQIAAEGIDEAPVDDTELEQYCFERFWPEIMQFSRKMIVEYKTKYSYYEDNRYVSYQIIGISDIRSGYGLKHKMINLYKPGFEKLMGELIKLNKDEQLDILNGLKDETEALEQLVMRGEFQESGDENNYGRRYEFNYFPNVLFKGEADIQLSTSEKSRLYLAKDMDEYPDAWLEAISYMERKLEHAINNVELFNVHVKNPIYDIRSILKEVYIIESEEGALQGTAFNLQGVGLVTCHHCVYDGQSDTCFSDLVIFKADDLKKKLPVIVQITNQHIDIALLRLVDESLLTLENGLTKGNSDSINYLDSVAVAGFPNYNFGDTGYFTIGQVTGFRTISGIAHILVSNVLVAGNSGGPAFDENGNVIGIVVTGSDTFLNSSNTEKHGLIPINAMDLLF